VATVTEPSATNRFQLLLSTHFLVLPASSHERRIVCTTNASAFETTENKLRRDNTSPSRGGCGRRLNTRRARASCGVIFSHRSRVVHVFFFHNSRSASVGSWAHSSPLHQPSLDVGNSGRKQSPAQTKERMISHPAHNNVESHKRQQPTTRMLPSCPRSQ
jgi:hypothetical protein